MDFIEGLINLKLEFTVANLEPISTNKMYMPRPMRGGKSAYLTKTNEYRHYESVIYPRLEQLISDESVEELKTKLFENDQLALSLSFDFIMPKAEYFRNDVSNYIKVLEDCIKNRLGIDDTRNCRVYATKHISDNKKWSTNVVLEIYELDELIPESRWLSSIKK